MEGRVCWKHLLGPVQVSQAEERNETTSLTVARRLQPCPKPDKLDLCTLLSPTSVFGQVTARTHNRLTRLGVRQHCPHGFTFLSKSLTLVLRKGRPMLESALLPLREPVWVTHQNEKTDMEEAKQSYVQEEKGNIKNICSLA